MLKKIWDIKLVRFASVGTFNTGFDLILLNIFVFAVDLSPVVGNIIAATITLTASYFLNHKIVFRSQDPQSLKQLLQFLAVSAVGILIVQSAGIYTVTTVLARHYDWVDSLINMLNLGISAEAFSLNVAKILAVLCAMTWNFSAYHFVIFKQKPESILQ